MMAIKSSPLGQQMQTEIDQASEVFCQRLRVRELDNAICKSLEQKKAFYTIARGSSDAAANVLSYEFMAQLKKPVTSLPPSVFSLGQGVGLDETVALVLSQSGASGDLVASAKSAKECGAKVVAITNQPDSAVEAQADLTVPINAGPEIAVPATKTVIGTIATGMALLANIKPEYSALCDDAIAAMEKVADQTLPSFETIVAGLLRAQNVYVIGRGAGFGAAHEVALKLKECCALHAEAYSASEVLHGPMQLVTKPLTVLILDTGEEQTQQSIDKAHERFKELNSPVFRVRPSDMGIDVASPAAASAILLYLLYPIIRAVAVSLGMNPDTPETLSKVTDTI